MAGGQGPLVPALRQGVRKPPRRRADLPTLPPARGPMSLSVAPSRAVRAFHEGDRMSPAHLAYDVRSPPQKPAVWVCARCGAELEEACDPIQRRCPVDAELVTSRLEQAGATLLAMRTRSPYPVEYGSGWPDVVHLAIESYGWSDEPNRPAVPSAAAISSMDRTYAWLLLLPRSRYVLRRVVAGRSLVHPATGRHILSWHRLGRMLGADHHAVQRWHGQGIGLLVSALLTRGV